MRKCIGNVWGKSCKSERNHFNSPYLCETFSDLKHYCVQTHLNVLNGQGRNQDDKIPTAYMCGVFTTHHGGCFVIKQRGVMNFTLEIKTE